MNQKMSHARSWSKNLGACLVVLFALVHLSTAWRHAFFDAHTSPQWRIQRLIDDTQNTVRAESILKYGYRGNPVLPSALQQLFLMSAALTHHLVPETYTRTRGSRSPYA
jgi:hypothetical protein